MRIRTFAALWLIPLQMFGSKALKNEVSTISKPFYEIASLGAPTTRPIIKETVGAINKRSEKQIQPGTNGGYEGFSGLSSTSIASLYQEAGLSPNHPNEPADIAFTFSCRDIKEPFTPIIVRPDGTILRGLPMTQEHSPQTLEISTPAQTGIYTLFVLAHEQHSPDSLVTINTKVSSDPLQNKAFQLGFFDPKNKTDSKIVSAEFLYTPLPK